MRYDPERYRGKWIAVDRRDEDQLVASALSLEQLHDRLKAFPARSVVIWRVPTRDDPVLGLS